MSQLVQMLGSVVIGSLLLLSILNFSTSVMDKTHEQMLETINQADIDATTDLLIFDFRKIGLNASSVNIISSFSERSIQFLADINDDQNDETITYTFSNEPNNSTLNPDDHFLYRRIDNGPNVNIALGVTDFKLLYYDNHNQTPANPGDIKTIEIQLTIESIIPYKISNQNKFIKNYWQTKISPPNLIY